MGFYTHAGDLAKAQQRKFSNFVRTSRTIHKEVADDMLREAVNTTSGNTSQKVLDALGNPFGRGGDRKTFGKRGHRLRFSAKGAAPLLPINVQTGRLVRAWRIIPRSSGSGSVTYTLQNTSPESKFVLAVGGTKKMVARGFWPHMRKAYQGRTRARMQRARTAQILILKGQ